MSMQTKTIGRMPTDHGPYDPQLAYGKKFQCTLFGCAWESLHDDNNTAPAVWDGGDIITPNLIDWKKVSGDYEAWLMNKDKPAASEQYPFNGMGRVRLLKNIVNGVNTLTQAMITQQNTIYAIQYDFTLGEDITVPANCVLEFDGGSIDGAYILTGNNTGIQAGLVKIFSTAVVLNGSWKLLEIYPEWFGAKGDGIIDFDNRPSGTDDSAAINKAISAATDMGVNKVKFASSIYYISNGIQINVGAIKLEGVQCNLMDSDAFPGYSIGMNKVSATTLLGSETLSKIITIGENVTHSIEVYNIEFRTYNITSGIGISFESEFFGPVWPFIVKYCSFSRFDKCIQFTSSINYNCSDIHIESNAFYYSNYCVYFGDNTNDSLDRHNNTETNLTFALFFNNNNAHQNSYIIRGTVTDGKCYICNNNLEGSRDTGVQDDHIIKLDIGEGAHLVIEGNHCEFMHSHLLALGIITRGAVIDINNNEWTTDGSNRLHNRVDIVKGSDYGIVINTFDVAYLYIHQSCSLIWDEPNNKVFTNVPSVYLDDKQTLVLSSNSIIRGNYIAPDHNNFFINYPNGTMQGGKLYTKLSGDGEILTGSMYVNPAKSIRYFVHNFETPEDMSYTNYNIHLSWGGNNNSYNYFNYCGNRRYFYCVTRNSEFTSPLDCRISKCGKLQRAIRFKTFTSDSEIELHSLLAGLEMNNVISDNILTSVVGQSFGDEIFIAKSGVNKKYIWVDGNWVDATGTPV